MRERGARRARVLSSDAHRQRVHRQQYKGDDEHAAGSGADSGFHSPVHAVAAAAGRRSGCCISFHLNSPYEFSLARATIRPFRIVPMSPAIHLVLFVSRAHGRRHQHATDAAKCMVIALRKLFQLFATNLIAKAIGQRSAFLSAGFPARRARIV
jgi:hypothetical protein